MEAYIIKFLDIDLGTNFSGYMTPKAYAKKAKQEKYQTKKFLHSKRNN